MSKTEITEINTMLKHLLMAYKYCRMYADLKDMIYNPERETVDVFYYGYMKADHTREVYKLEVNVACDSHAAMIDDVEKKLYKFFS